ncbi:MAG TPA: ABC transporter permease [Anaerolineales bacterium]|nr:ABC transporter permease [Anaerolineales bacterium]
MRRPTRFLSRWPNRFALGLLAVFVVVAAAAPALSPMDPKEPGVFKRVGRVTDLNPHPPDDKALLGTLPGQVDVFHALVWGTRGALAFGVVVALGALLLGAIVGAVAGYAGGPVNNLLMRTTDAFLAFPLIAAVALVQQMVAMTIQSMGGTYWFHSPFAGMNIYFDFTPPLWTRFLMSVDPVMICLILLLWVPYARLFNTQVLTLKRSDFVRAAYSLGGGPAWVIRRHLLPNALRPALVMVATDIGAVVILQATFTFIGLGGNSAWGKLLSIGRDWVIGPGGDVLRYWWVFIPATLAVILFGVTWNMLGDGLHDALDPRRG